MHIHAISDKVTLMEQWEIKHIMKIVHIWSQEPTQESSLYHAAIV